MPDLAVLPRRPFRVAAAGPLTARRSEADRRGGLLLGIVGGRACGREGAAPRLRRLPLLARCVVLALLVAAAPIAAAAEATAAGLVLQAKGFIDAYFGDPINLQRAAALLQRAMALDAHDANVYVQAARLTINGGHLVGDRFVPGSVQAYRDLVEQALAIDPNLGKAHILMAEVYDLQHDYAGEKAELDLAQRLSPPDPWVWMGFARHADRMRDTASAYRYYKMVRAMGPGRSVEDRNAYVSALARLSRYSVPGEPLELPALAALARKERHPKDAWILGDFAGQFLDRGLFDEAIDYAREALRTMNYGVARLQLAAALYARAAALTVDGEAAAAAPFVTEAARLGFKRDDIVQRLSRGDATVRRLLPTVEQLVEAPGNDSMPAPAQTAGPRVAI